MAENEYVTEITDQTDDFSRWYQEVVLKARLADYAPVRGCMVIRPYGYALWENMQRLLDARIKASGHVNAYFPLFVPESLLAKEAEHVEGFAPQVAWVTHVGNEALEERLVVRPTSEAVIGPMYARWIDSWRDLPILINQWANVVRWEKVTRLFLRTTEFLWQEGHTVHATEEEAEEETLRILEMYRAFLEEDLAIPAVAGLKTENERFAGALRTYSVEALMRDGKALQAGTSHNLGQHFSRVYEVKFLDKDNREKYGWQTSWGVSTRLIGAVVMVHGDDAGLLLPPRIAPYQAVIVPIWKNDREKRGVLAAARRVCKQAEKAGVRVHLDDREQHSPGWKFNEWEMCGVPLRMEVGPREVAEKRVMLARRDTRERWTQPVAGLGKHLVRFLEELQRAVLERAIRFQQENTHHPRDFDEFAAIVEEKRGFLYAPWCGQVECELAIKEKTKATVRCLPMDRKAPDAESCIHCGEPARERALFARAY